ncbi:hypothetical protein ACFWAZ_23440 [Streptomyces collinus]|uniref:hypothetical protein n=1 Tax=Streptomyces collinus TaxID=42684 RepID=UPI0036465E3F
MERRDDVRRAADAQAQPPPAEVAYDQWWAGDLGSAVRCSGALLCLLLLIDWAAGDITPARGALWATLAVLLFVILHPARVAAGEDWLASRGLVREHRVRTDHLVSVHWLDGVSQRLVLRDSFGGRVEIDPQVLVANPGLWYRLDKGARRSSSRGSLTCGETALRRVAERIDSETALAVFKVSGLE